MAARVAVAGVGMTAFVKPGLGALYFDMGAAAVMQALDNAGVDYSDLQQAYVGYVYGNSTRSAKPHYTASASLASRSSTSTTCVRPARPPCSWPDKQSRRAPRMFPRAWLRADGARCARNHIRRSAEPAVPLHDNVADAAPQAKEKPLAIKLFGAAGVEYQERYEDQEPNVRQGRREGQATRRAQRTCNFSRAADGRRDSRVADGVRPDDAAAVLPPTCGAAAAILVSGQFAKRKGLKRNVRIRGQAMTTDFPSTFNENSMIKVVGYDLTVKAAQKVYAETGVSPRDLDVVELHDCFTANEILSYEGLGLTPEGTAEQFIWDGDNTYGGKVVTNPSGGLLSERSSAWRDRACAVRRTGVAAARQDWPPTGGERQDGSSAQYRYRQCLRGDALRAGLRLAWATHYVLVVARDQLDRGQAAK